MVTQSPAVVVAQRDGTVISQNKPAKHLLGTGTGKYCWDVVGGLEDAQGLPCRRGCVLELLTRGMDRSQHSHCKINGQRYHLNCVPVDGTAVCTLSRAAAVAPQAWQSLTPRERDILELLAAGETTPSAADCLGISESTVRTHVENMRAKLGVNTRAALVAGGFRLGYLD